MITMNEPQPDRPTPAVMQLEVTNGNDFDIEDFFDGIPVRFPAGQTVTVSPDQAMHCFGYPGEARDVALYMAKRYGWSGRDYLIAEGEREPKYRQLAAKIFIKPVYFDLVRRDRNDPILADHGEEDDEPPEPSMGADTGTRAGKRRKTPARLGAPRGRPKGSRNAPNTADVRLRAPRR